MAAIELSEEFKILMNARANITAISEFITEKSDRENNRYVFAYTITIENISNESFQLLFRHWIIEDANFKTEEVYGEGVVGKKPVINSRQSYSYSSLAVLETEMGTMQGKYFVQAENGTGFELIIPKFILAVPRVLH